MDTMHAPLERWLSRRRFLELAGTGIGTAALATLFGQDLAARAPAASRSICFSSSMATIVSTRLASIASRRILSASTTWFAMRTLPAPASAKTSASDTFAAHTPPTVPPAAICIANIRGDLWFLPWGRKRMCLSR